MAQMTRKPGRHLCFDAMQLKSAGRLLFAESEGKPARPRPRNRAPLDDGLCRAGEHVATFLTTWYQQGTVGRVCAEERTSRVCCTYSLQGRPRWIKRGGGMTSPAHSLS